MKRTKPTPVLDWFRETAEMAENPEVRAFRAEGGKAVGMFYPDTPVELLEAAGCMCFSLRGNTAQGTELGDAFFKNLTCQFSRATFNEILDEKYAFLDGAVWYNNCDHMRRIYDNWKGVDKASPAYFLFYYPKHRDDRAYGFYRDQIHAMIEATEARFGVKITPEKVLAAIREGNETRRLIRELYALREGDEIYIDGSETASVLMTLCSVPRAVANEKLAALIAELKGNAETAKPKFRLFYAGYHADRPDILGMLEKDRGLIVCDTLGNGLAAAERDIPTLGDPIENVIHYYFWDKVPQPRVWGTQDERMDRALRLSKAYRCDGIIAARIAFCDQLAFEQYLLLGATRRAGIPYLQLETTYDPEGIGQVRTRVQAFLESIETRTNDAL